MVIEKTTAFCEQIDYVKLSARTIEMAKKCFLDYIGAAFAGYQTKAGQIALHSGHWLGRDGLCTVLGQTQLSSPLGAAFINGTLSSALDLDDGHRGAVGHPGVMVFSAALAASEINPCVSGPDFIAAVVAGYEVAIRCGIVMNSCHEQRFYGSGGWAVFGAAAAAARLLGLSGQKLKNAISVVEVYGPTAQCTKSILYGAMSKESIGWGAVTALFSALLAKQGFTGPGEILLDDIFYQPGVKDVFLTLGSTFEIENIYFKRFSSCRWSHSPITAALAIREKHRPCLGVIKSIKVETFSKALTLSHKSPQSTEAAQYSIPYTISAALKYGQMGASQVADECLSDCEIMGLAKKVELVHAPDLEQLFPDRRPARVTLTMAGGESYTEEVHLVPGDPEYPLNWDDLSNKFRASTASFLDANVGEKIIETVSRLENYTHLKDLLWLLQKGLRRD